MKYCLAIDMGASSGRHILGYIENDKLHLEEIYRFENGIVDIDKLKRAIRTDTILISIMSINNELGSVMQIKEIGDITKKKKVLFFCIFIKNSSN